LENLLLQQKACKTIKITDLAQGIFKMPEEVLPEELEKSKVGIRTASAGMRLREERLSKGIKRTAIAEKLHITNHYVKAIESDSFDKLPGAIFTKGYLKNYAELLDLNPTEIIGLYEKTVSKVNIGINSEDPSYKLKARNQIFVITSVILFIFLFVALWVYDNIFREESTTDFAVAVELGGSQSYQSKAISNSEIYPPREKKVSISENNSVFAVLGRNVTPDYDQFDKVIDFNSPGQDTLDILFSGESWIEITDEPTGERFREIMIAGDLLRVKGKAPFSVLVSDAPAARIRFNGAEISLMDSIRIDNSASLTLGM
tara:strand:- start:2619 stop:3566 length:948 start_codon:yes stop_codon:yes gene_type:complete